MEKLLIPALILGSIFIANRKPKGQNSIKFDQDNTADQTPVGVGAIRKKTRQAFEQEILDSVWDDDEEYFDNIEDASKHLIKTFNQWSKGYYERRYPNNQERFSEYLMGLPHHFEYSNDAIQKFLNNVLPNPKGKKFSSEQAIKRYHYYIWKIIEPYYYG